ncbi:MAG TPA: SDR family oxidoreductase [Lentisphaerae bacterium]|nr:SDR family oxidoreductase [Lentisphaerota bacterium]
MKILVAGGCGYVGSALVPRLAERGYDVRVIDTLWFGNYLPKDTSIEKKDLFELCQQDLRGFDQVVFLAGLSNDPMAEFSPSLNFIHNAAAPAYLAYISKKAGVKRFVFASTCSVYGYQEDALCTEQDPAVSSYPYGISKLQGERAVMQMADSGFSVICLRKGTVCGHSPRMRFDLVVNTMFMTAMTEEVIRVYNPEIWRPILSIQDAVSAYVRATEAAPHISGVFNVASGNYTVGEIGDVVRDRLQELSGRQIRLLIEHRDEYRSYKVDIRIAMATLSFKPRHDVEAIVDDLWAHRSEYGDYAADEFYNIRIFRKLFPKAH